MFSMVIQSHQIQKVLQFTLVTIKKEIGFTHSMLKLGNSSSCINASAFFTQWFNKTINHLSPSSHHRVCNHPPKPLDLQDNNNSIWFNNVPVHISLQFSSWYLQLGLIAAGRLAEACSRKASGPWGSSVGFLCWTLMSSRTCCQWWILVRCF